MVVPEQWLAQGLPGAGRAAPSGPLAGIMDLLRRLIKSREALHLCPQCLPLPLGTDPPWRPPLLLSLGAALRRHALACPYQSPHLYPLGGGADRAQLLLLCCSAASARKARPRTRMGLRRATQGGAGRGEGEKSCLLG